MSDLLIRGMELPENCWSCKMFCNCYACEGYDCHCAALGEDIGTEAEVPRNKRRDDCPLIPVPPHDGEAFEKVISERITQIEKWGKEPCNHPFEWMSILGEEFGELCEAVNETCFMNGTHPERGGDENIIREATQIAAVAIAIIRDFSPTIIPAEIISENEIKIIDTKGKSNYDPKRRFVIPAEEEST